MDRQQLAADIALVITTEDVVDSAEVIEEDGGVTIAVETEDGDRFFLSVEAV